MDAACRFHQYLVAMLMSLAAPWLMASECAESTPGLSRFYSDGWGIDKANTRFQPGTEDACTTTPRAPSL